MRYFGTDIAMREEIVENEWADIRVKVEDDDIYHGRSKCGATST